MFDLVRRHTKVLMFLMFLLIIPAFVLVGVDGYQRFNDPAQSVARVGGHDITQIEWDAAHRQEVERIRQSAPTIDIALLDSPQAKYASLERLVRDRVLAEAATQQNLQTSDARLARDLHENPTIASLRKPDGSMDMERYRQLAASQGLSPEGFEARVRRDLSIRQVEAGVLSTTLVVPAVADVSLSAFFEQREIELARFPASAFVAKASPSDADLESYYKANTAQFAAPESVDIEYVVFDLAAIKGSIQLPEADVKTYYEQNVARMSGTEERRASHILINAPKDMAAADRAKAKTKAKELLAEVRKSPDRFAELAKKHSTDKASGASGGDLDFFTRGAMVKPFEDAAFSMKKGDISEVVESDFGYHIIQLTDLKQPKQKSFEEMRAGIETELKAQQAQRKFAESADAFMDAVYSQFDSLKPVAEKYKLEIKTAKDVQRTPRAGTEGVVTNPKFIAALYENDSLNAKRNTKAIEVGPSQLVSGRVVKHTTARTRSLDEVRDQVRARLVATRSAELARAAGQARLAEWKAKPGAAGGEVAKLTVARDQAQGLEPPLLDAVMKADPITLPAYTGASLGEAGYAVAKINRVVARSAPSPTEQRQAETQVARMWASAENQAMYQVLRQRYKTRVNVPDPISAATGGTTLR